MIVVVPALTPVTNPVLLIVATAGLEETHGVVVAAVPLPVNCVVPCAQITKVPVIVDKGFTVTVAVI